MIYDIANLKVEIKNENGRTEKQAIPYLAQNQDEKNIDININNYYNKNIKVTKSNLLITKMAKGEIMREKLKKIRKEQNLTQKSLSKSVNIHRTHYSMIENGRRNPSLKVAVSIKKALNYQYDDIFEKQ